jgi:hypothetical protein
MTDPRADRGQENVDLADMVARMAESLAELIMLGP